MIVVSAISLRLRRVRRAHMFLRVGATQCFFAAMAQQLLAAIVVSAISLRLRRVRRARAFLRVGATQCFFAAMVQQLLTAVTIAMHLGRAVGALGPQVASRIVQQTPWDRRLQCAMAKQWDPGTPVCKTPWPSSGRPGTLVGNAP